MMVMITAMTPSEKASRRAGLDIGWRMEELRGLVVDMDLGLGAAYNGISASDTGISALK
jgi:hypothetical protein